MINLDDLYLCALNYRCASKLEDANNLFNELVECVDNMVKQEREYCASICDEESTIEGIAQRCAKRIRDRSIYDKK